MIYRRLKTSCRPHRSRGAALVELALTFPLALTIVLAAVHISHVLRESILVVEAARHGARTVTAKSGRPTGTVPSNWWGITTTAIPGSGAHLCSEALTGTAPNYSAEYIAWLASCDFLEQYFGSTKWNSDKANWEVQTSINGATEGSATFFYVSVTLRAKNSRGPVDFFIPFIDLKPHSTAVYPLMQVGWGG